MRFEQKLGNLESQLKAVQFHEDHDRLAADPAAFAREVLGLDLDDWQRAVIEADSKRDILNCSRQAGKSTTAAVLALHEALYKPGSLTILVSPSQRQSSELFRKVVELRNTLPEEPDLTEDNRLSMTVQGGGRVLSLPGTEATTRGFSGATLIIEDEASRVDDHLYFAMRPMLATSNGRMILMSTPFGQRGHFWETWDKGGDGWNCVKVPATQVPRIAPEWLEEERRSMGEWWYQQEYMCEFVDAEDAVFQMRYIEAALSEDVKSLRLGAGNG
jgi:hypothetical protein